MARGETHEPTKKLRDQVDLMCSAGIPHALIAKCLGIAPGTLRKHYGHELETSRARRTSDIAGAFFRNAMRGNVAAQIFYLKTQAGWKVAEVETDDVPTKFEIRVTKAPDE
jgi:hypothetical protein